MFRLPKALLISLLLLPAACKRGQEDDEVVARVGRAAITQAEFHRKLAEVAPGFQSYVATPYGRRQFLDVLIREKLILESAKSDGTDQTPPFIERMGELRRDEEAKMKEARDYLLTRLWIDHLRERGVVAATDDELRDYHKRNPVEVKARHILLATADDAEAAIARLRHGASFAEAAKKQSLDGDTASEGGRMRSAILGETLPELEVLFKMKTGELGGPVRSKFGYHILLKDGEERPSFEALKDRIKDVIEKQKLDRHLQTMQASFRVEVVDAQFK